MPGDPASQQLRDLQRVTDAALSYLPLEQLLDELLVRSREILHVDTAALLLLEEDGRSLVALAAKGLEEEVERVVRIPVGRGFAGRIAADRRPVYIPDVATADIFNPILREKGLKSLLGVPLLVEGRVIGVLHVGTLAPREFTADDTELLQRVSDRASLAISARLYERQRGLADEIHRALIPRSLPTFPGVTLAGRYTPAAAAPLGGDWYDAFVLPTGSLGLVIGDVVGRGFRAAALMSQLRSAVRAYALDGMPPMRVLSKVNGLLRNIEPGGSATMLLIIFDSDTGQARVAAAGHPPPLVATGDDEPIFSEVPGTVPLGVAANPSYDETVIEVQPPARLLLYTDGIMERANERLEDGLERLRELTDANLEPEALCDQLMHTLLPNGASSDDAALLVMAAGELAADLEVNLPAEPDSAPLLRRIIRRWLRERGAAGDEIDELTLAVAEASANAIEHAYAPESQIFRVIARCDDGTILLQVRDWGQWRPPRGTHRGRGMMLMQGLTDSVDVDPRSTGTTVTLRRQLKEAQPA